MWYGNEILQHRNSETEGEALEDSCVTIHITEKTPPTTQSPSIDSEIAKHRNNFMSVIWKEKAYVREYSFQYNSMMQRGLWYVFYACLPLHEITY